MGRECPWKRGGGAFERWSFLQRRAAVAWQRDDVVFLDERNQAIEGIAKCLHELIGRGMHGLEFDEHRRGGPCRINIMRHAPELRLILA